MWRRFWWSPHCPCIVTPAKDDYKTFVSLNTVDLVRKGPPNVFLAEYYFAAGDYLTAAHYYMEAWKCGAEHTYDVEKLGLSLAANFLASESAIDPEVCCFCRPAPLSLVDSV